MFLYNKESVYRFDQDAVKIDGLSEISLMQRAGERVWQEITNRWPELCRVTIFAGSGNNGGDAFVVAILAKQHGVEVQLIVHGDMSRQSETSLNFRKIWQQDGGDIVEWHQQKIIGEVVVDGLLGIGLKRALDDDWQSLIRQINLVDSVRVAIDIPSGLNANTGKGQPCSVYADLTVSFIAAKPGQYLADGPDFCGELIIEDLGISSGITDSQVPAMIVLEPGDAVLPATRYRNSHKNHFGHILIVGGDQGMVGAASLAAQAALRGGAGLVTVLVHPDCVHDLSVIPELMVSSWDAINEKLELATVVVIGPGLGSSRAANNCLEKLKAFNGPVVVDASALRANFITALKSEQVVITPHPGEAANLLSMSVLKIQGDRTGASRNLTEKFNAVSVLKGSGSIIQQSGSIPAINVRGNPGMASAGMGDVLAGLIAALLAQKLSPLEAAKTGVLIHALCAEDYAEHNDECGLIASDTIQRIPLILKQLRELLR